MTLLEKTALTFLGLVLILGFLAAAAAPEYYLSVLSAEDGPLEWATAAFLFVGCLVCLRRAIRGGKGLRHTFIFGMGALILFFGAGEEISWGQRVFGWGSGEFFAENNAQGETNLHNLMAGDVKINKVIFGALLSLAFAIYFVVLPWILRRNAMLRELANAWFIPVPKWQHGVAFVIALIVMSLTATDRAPELGEFAIGLLLMLAVTYPANRDRLE